MNLYLVKRISGFRYDYFDAFVCSAESEDQAADIDIAEWVWGGRLAFISEKEKCGELVWAWIDNKDEIEVIKIGTSDYDDVRVICASYNAG